MKILYIHQYFKTPQQPGGTRSYWFAKELIENGHEVVMLTSSPTQENFIEKKTIDGIQVIYVRNYYSNYMGIFERLWAFIKFMLASTWIGLFQKDIDLVYATSTPLSVGVPALILKKLKGIKYIFEVRDLWPEVPIQMGAIKNKWIIRFLRLFEKTIYDNATHVVALSPGMQDGVIAAGTLPDKVTMIPNMSKKDEFFKRPKNAAIAEEFGINLNNFNAVHFGSMGIANGLNYIIDAAEQLKLNKADHINIIFLGIGKTQEELMDRCTEKGLDNVKFLGRHPMETVSEVVNICDASIISFQDIPILYTNSPNKLFDSLSAEMPLIVNSAGWTKDIVEQHACGIYVDPHKPQELAEALVNLSVNPEWVKEMSKNSRKLAEEVYDKTILCKQFVKVIENRNVQKSVEAVY
ncbi:glycosyltransferase family 4 protein [Pontibacter arcticus]|uniref:Glycosyltransferase WbuB n=1 Tax=Pontibacter arcticus TaxID=2080288 RepID=A0A364RDU0_9BACT|nr:glycosyltransferase family 4 protein [Pontibacter arcticus]RAU82427.1 glycosyltransferase WbuB [Pontibacter arcticus]